MIVCIVFFFQAEDGIRDVAVTGVQTCALPISSRCTPAAASSASTSAPNAPAASATLLTIWPAMTSATRVTMPWRGGSVDCRARSEERRVGKEWRSRWAPDHEKKKDKLRSTLDK